jgi:hypothetical protein
MFHPLKRQNVNCINILSFTEKKHEDALRKINCKNMYIRRTPIHGSKTSLDYYKAREIGNH